MKNLAILGLGHIGTYVFETLRNNPQTFNVTGYDLRIGFNLHDETVLRNIIKDVDGVLASTPYFLNTKIAKICNEYGVDYFDLTESVEVTEFVKTLDNAKFVTQCGLAPGIVSMIANYFSTKFDKVKNIEIKVGALPENASNHLGYYRTWNTEGLINEYIHKCVSIQNGALAYLEPCEYIENVLLNGARLEAATTSGGLGSLAESFLGKAENVTYKTLRYPGHWNYIKFLKDDLGLAKNFDTYVKLINENIPQTVRDFVFILIEVNGYKDSLFKIEQYSKIIPCTSTVTAIQHSTGSGVMAVLDVWANDKLPNKKGHIKQEEISFDNIYNSNYFECYR